MKVSTGLRNKLLDNGSLKSIMDLGSLKIYAGTVPASADDDLGAATLLCTITQNSSATGISLDTAAVGGVIAKAAEVWSGLNSATGTATFFRHVAAGDTGASSTTEARIQGTVGTAGADLNISSVALVSGATQTVDFYNLALPTL